MRSKRRHGDRRNPLDFVETRRDVNNKRYPPLVAGVVTTRRVEVAYGTKEASTSVPTLVNKRACCEKTRAFHLENSIFRPDENGTLSCEVWLVRCENFASIRLREVGEIARRI